MTRQEFAELIETEGRAVYVFCCHLTEKDEESGKISRKEGYNGINLLFSLPADASKANSQAVQEYLTKLEESWQEDSEENEELTKKISEIEAFLIRGENVEALKDFTAVGEPIVLVPDVEGAYYYIYSNETSEEIYIFYQENFKNGQDYSISHIGSDEEESGLSIVLLIQNADGTATVQRYEEN